MNVQTPLKLTALFFSALLITACGGGSSNKVANTNDDSDNPITNGLEANEFLIDASAGGRLESRNRSHVYVDLKTGKVVEGIDDDNASSETNKDKWQIAFKRTSPIKLNGGVSGAGTTAGALAIESDMYTDDDEIADTFANLTADSEVGKFNNFTLAQAKALTHVKDSNGLTVASNDWGVYSGPPRHAIDMTNKWWIVEGGNKSYVKMRVKEYNPPNITIEYYFAADENTPYPTSNPLTYTTNISGDSGSECIDFDTAAPIANCDINNPNSGEWDLLWERDATARSRNLWTNGGIIGSGSGGARGPRQYLTEAEDPNAGIRGQSDNFGPYKRGAWFTNARGDFNIGVVSDSESGVFSAEENGAAKYGWAEYSLADNSKMWPNYRVWSIRTGADEASYKYYKLQILNYYHPDDPSKSGVFTIRSEEL